MTTATSFGATAVLKDVKIQIGSFDGSRSSNSVGLSRRHVNLFSVSSSTSRPNSLIRAVSTSVKPETETKHSKVEIIKEHSNFIRYPLNEELLTDAPNINESATQIIKFHGSYEQYNRGERGARSYSFMLRTKNPSFQLHGVLKKNLKTVMSSIIHSVGSTLGACGDPNRNVLAPAAPFARKDYQFAQQTADDIAALLTPQSGFYYDMWVDGEKIMSAEPP
ncbi:unnamed protein product [Dovyalis caffra]|uniref:Uncharacterized protein n=1 Tax=Dovyalis caffra TaxID=77055 RepID=A0AAV1R9C4_9ROSI|nr:unnamed protein product [Dovyalis caffra]